MTTKIIEKSISTERMKTTAVKPNYFSNRDIENFKQGSHFHLYQKFGAHPIKMDGIKGTYFSVWAPRARKVSVVGDFNGWKKLCNILNARGDGSGIWEGFVPHVLQSDLYKFHIISKNPHGAMEKADPYAHRSELAPKTASIVYDLKYAWGDQQWMDNRKHIDYSKQPMSIYEVHLGSWRRKANGDFLTYTEMANDLVRYVKHMGFTHVEFMPLMEHPFYGSWGYQALSYFAPTSRYGTPEELMYLIDQFHQNGIGVILDWVASHFPCDKHGIVKFDGAELFEENGLHPDWQSCIFNLGRCETVNFLISSAMFWLEQYHIDGLRVDAVASMLYLDYSRRDGEWEPNIFGGRENLEAISFIRCLNKTVKETFPEVQMIAEESTAWPKVSQPSNNGGLNFDMKWNMGWMHDTLKYFCRDCKKRGKFYDEIAFCLYYAFNENFVLSLSHDEVVYEKSSLIGKMPGKDWEKFSNLRVLLGYMYSHPGKKLLFMGSEIAQWAEWNHDSQLEWGLLQHDRHKQIQNWVKDLNELYKNEPALHEQDFSPNGFEWLDMGHNQKSIFSFLRKGIKPKDDLLIVCNFANRARRKYKIGISHGGSWSEILSSNMKRYGGKESKRIKRISAKRKKCIIKGFGYATNASHHVKDYSLTLDLPPLSITFLKNKELS